MQGLLADVNVQGHLATVRILLRKSGLIPLLSELGLRLVTFPELDLHPGLDDRSLWNFCQQQGWVLFTENRNHDGPDSLYGTLADSWKDGCLPVLTLANKRRFEHESNFRLHKSLREIHIFLSNLYILLLSNLNVRRKYIDGRGKYMNH